MRYVVTQRLCFQHQIIIHDAGVAGFLIIQPVDVIHGQNSLCDELADVVDPFTQMVHSFHHYLVIRGHEALQRMPHQNHLPVILKPLPDLIQGNLPYQIVHGPLMPEPFAVIRVRYIPPAFVEGVEILHGCPTSGFVYATKKCFLLVIEINPAERRSPVYSVGRRGGDTVAKAGTR